MTRTSPWLAPSLCSVVLTGLILAIVARDYPLIGHDHRYYIPRLLDTLLHLKANGFFAVQWYTPTFGGGLPAFANPQHLQHSVLQVLTQVVNPWLAILLTTAVVSLVGFHACVRLLQRRAGLSGPASTLGAVVFIGNGFYIEHLIVGHVGFQLFPLSAVLLYLLTDARGPILRNASVVALVLALMLYHAGVYLIVLTGLSLLLALPLLIVFGARIEPRRLGVILITATLLAAAMAAAKAHAVLGFMWLFPRKIDDLYSVGLLQGLVGLAAQLAGVMSLAPLFAIAGLDMTLIAGGLSRLTGASDRFGIWELDASLSPVVWLVIATALVKFVRQGRGHGWPAIEPRVWSAGAGAAVVTWVLIEATLAKGVVYPLLKPLPILRSLHVNPRVAGAFILPLAIVAAALAHRWFAEKSSIRLMNVLLCLALASPLSYFLLPPRIHQRSFEVTLSLDAYRRIQGGDQLRVLRVADLGDAEALAIGASSLRVYEPLFGYALEHFAAEVVAGDVRQIREGAFNLTNPAGLLFPELNGLRPFDRVAVTDAANFETFVRRGQPVWAIPPVQRWLNCLAVAAFALTLCLLVGLSAGFRRNPIE